MMNVLRVALLFFILSVSLTSAEVLYGATTLVGGSPIKIMKYTTTDSNDVEQDSDSEEVIASFPSLTFATQGQCTFDTKSKIIYFLAKDKKTRVTSIYGVSLTTGELLSKFRLPKGTGPTAGENPLLAYNTNKDLIIYLAKGDNDDHNDNNNDDNDWEQYEIRPSDGASQLINAYPNAYNFSTSIGDGSYFDPVYSIQWFPCEQYENNLTYTRMCGLGLEDKSSNFVLTDIAAGTPVYSGLPDGTMYSLEPVNVNFYTVQWNSTDTSVSVASHVEGWTGAANTATAFNPATNTLFSCLSPSIPSTKFSLVGVDVNTGITQSSAPINTAAWCLSYIPE